MNSVHLPFTHKTRHVDVVNILVYRKYLLEHIHSTLRSHLSIAQEPHSENEIHVAKFTNLMVT